MKIEVESRWSTHRERPHVYFTITGENDMEKALLLSLYSVKPKWIPGSEGSFLSFYPEGYKK